jgi:hypothetical protein
MVVVQIYATTQARTVYNINLPTGLYQFRMIDFVYIDNQAARDHTVVTIKSDCWRVPYGNASRSNTLYFVNKSDNGRSSPQGSFNFLAEVRNGQMDLTLTGATALQFQFAILSFDAQPTASLDNFFPLV